MILTAFSLIPFYLLGAFPSGFLIAKARGVNIFSQGSGNVGATNIARTLGRTAGIATLILDIVKGWLAVQIAWIISADIDYTSLVGFVAVLGHCFSIPGKLRGGKGVATALGVLWAMHPQFALVALVVFGVALVASQTVSLSSLSAALLVPIFGFFSQAPDCVVYSAAAMGLLITIRHKQNLIRLIEGREAKFTFGKNSNPDTIGQK